jgi:glycosyltransferase involved in cell wall biosynthesis
VNLYDSKTRIGKGLISLDKLMLTISIITVVRNNAATVRESIESVLNQNYPIEYLIVDGGSTDGTLDIINEYTSKVKKIISEPDNGVYDAINKGLRIASGDILGIIHSDDIYENNEVIPTIMNEFESTKVDSVFADLVYVKREDPDKIVRYYNSSSFNPDKFVYGWMPAHPTFFVRRTFYDKYGLFKTDYKIAADFELLARFLGKHKLSYKYLPKVIIRMRTGGISTSSLKSNWTLNREIIRACKENSIETNMLKVYSKYFIKVFQLIQRPGESRF